jgi:putative membrane protein
MVLALCAAEAAIAAESASSEDRAFLAWDVQVEIQQQDMGRLAARRALTAEVRDLGNHLAERHLQTEERLRYVAKQLGVTLSDKLSATHLRVQSRYKAIPSASFDKAFVRHEVGDYQYFLTKFERVATAGGPAVSAFAKGEIPSLKEDQGRIVALMHEQNK